MTDEEIKAGDRVEVFLNTETWNVQGWFGGVVIRIDPYTAHRSFIWVELDADAQDIPGKAARLISVLNPKNIRKV